MPKPRPADSGGHNPTSTPIALLRAADCRVTTAPDHDPGHDWCSYLVACPAGVRDRVLAMGVRVGRVVDDRVAVDGGPERVGTALALLHRALTEPDDPATVAQLEAEAETRQEYLLDMAAAAGMTGEGILPASIRVRQEEGGTVTVTATAVVLSSTHRALLSEHGLDS